MARPRKIDSVVVAQAQKVAARTDDVQELRMAQAILLPALAQMTLQATAKVLGVGRAAAGAHETGGRAGLFGGMEGQSRAGSVGGGDAAAGCSGTKVGPSAQALGGVSSTGTSSLAQSRARYPTSQGRARCP